MLYNQQKCEICRRIVAPAGPASFSHDLLLSQYFAPTDTLAALIAAVTVVLLLECQFVQKLVKKAGRVRRWSDSKAAYGTELPNYECTIGQPLSSSGRHQPATRPKCRPVSRYFNTIPFIRQPCYSSLLHRRQCCGAGPPAAPASPPSPTRPTTACWATCMLQPAWSLCAWVTPCDSATSPLQALSMAM